MASTKQARDLDFRRFMAAIGYLEPEVVKERKPRKADRSQTFWARFGSGTENDRPPLTITEYMEWVKRNPHVRWPL